MAATLFLARSSNLMCKDEFFSKTTPLRLISCGVGDGGDWGVSEVRLHAIYAKNKKERDMLTRRVALLWGLM